MRPPFPSVLDSTIIASFRSCPQRAFLEFIRHYKPQDPSVHLHAGAAYAKGLEVAREAYYVEGRNKADAEAAGLGALLHAYGSFECPEDSAKSATRMAGALEFYYNSYPFDTDPAVPIELPGGKRGIEFSFAEPIDVLHPETGDPIIYCGRMDMICTFDGMTLGEDDKTTSQLGANWSRQWNLRSQFTGYTWGARQAGIKLDGFLVRGVSILKTKYDTQQAITYRAAWMIDRWYTQLLRDVARMKKCWEDGYWDWSLDHACTEYGGCIFRDVCQMADPTPLLEQRFTRRVWNPLTRQEDIPND